MLGTNLRNMCIVGMCWYIRVLSPRIWGLESQRIAWKSNLKSVRSPHVPNNQKHRDFTNVPNIRRFSWAERPSLVIVDLQLFFGLPSLLPNARVAATPKKKLLLQRTTMMKHHDTHFDPTYFNIKLVVHAIICASAELQPKCLANMIPIPQKIGKRYLLPGAWPWGWGAPGIGVSHL